ncbi:MAG: efflux RND transporter permease subunit, partial [Chloroflexales bacterium]|nr:efflux RND transporter permease subunit [Chloroflexales bacterium]
MSSTRPKERLKGMPISDISIQQPVFITMMMLLAVVIGLLAYRSLPVNYLPDFSMPIVSVTVTYPGAGPETIAQQVSQPIEEALNTISGVDTINATASEGVAQIMVTFSEGVDIGQGIQNVREKVGAVAPRLPRDTGDPIFQQFDLGALPVLQLAVANDGSRSLLELRRLIDDTFVPALQRLDGVGSVTVSGGQERQINVLMDLDRLSGYQIAPSQISASIRNANTNLGLGSVDTGDQNISLRAPSQITTTQDIANLPITGTRYSVSDVARVEDGINDTTSYQRLNGQNAISLSVVKQAKANTVAVSTAARAEAERLFAAHPELKYIVTLDQSVQVKRSVSSSLEEMVLAVVAALLVVLFFFRDLRNTLVTMAGLPVILILTFGALALFGISINVISLLAVSLCVGLVIDDAIVVRENIFRYMERGYSARQAASRATAEVALSVVAMTLTVVAVFLPVTMTTGITGFIFKAFGLTVASAMLISLVEAFTFAPMLSANLFGSQRVTHHGHQVTQPEAEEDDPDAAPVDEAADEIGWLGQLYERVLAWSLRHRLLQLGLTTLVLIASVVVASGMKVQFLSSQLTETFVVSYELPPGSSLQRTDALARQAEAVIQADPDVLAVQSSIGGAGTPERGSLTVRARDSKIAETVRERLRAQLAFLPNLIYSAQSFSGMGGTGVTGRNIQVNVRSALPASELAPIAAQLEAAARGIPGMVDVGSTYQTGRPEVQFFVDPVRAGDLGITSNDLASSVRALINGDTATTLRQGTEAIDIVVRLDESQRSNPTDLAAITLPSSRGGVPISSVARIAVGTSPTSLRRTDLQNEIVIGANVGPGHNQAELQKALQAVIDQMAYPRDEVVISFGGALQNMSEGFSSLFIAMGLSVLFVYMVLASQFGSFTQPVVIMLAMPFSFIGAFVALRLTGMPLDITGMIGLIMLMGLVVKNSILLVDFTNKLRASGLEKGQAIARAGAIRLRPILMTSAAIIAGAVPTALGIHFFSSGEGAEFRRSLAVVLIGGMLTSTLLTLLVVPTAYSVLDSATGRFGRLFRRGTRTPAPASPPAVPTPVTAHTHD